MIKAGDKVRFLTGKLCGLSLDTSRQYGYEVNGVYEVLDTNYSRPDTIRLKASKGHLDGWNVYIEDVVLIPPYTVEEWNID